MASLRVVFRADASVTIGSGHVMRCLALADALQQRDARCCFICCEDASHLLEHIRARGHTADALVPLAGAGAGNWQEDSDLTRSILRETQPDWLIVDHYQLGQEWESHVRPLVRRLFAIDDLGRQHSCDLLLDQNFRNPIHERYDAARQEGAEVLLGPRFALLRADFARLRPESLSRRDGRLRNLLVTMGGTDPDDETSKALAGLRRSSLQLSIDVVVGGGNPNRRSVEAACARLPSARLHVDTCRMAALMAAADCAITAGGGTTWERCCLGLPALVTTLSPDQLPASESLAACGVHVSLGHRSAVTVADYSRAVGEISAASLQAMSAAAAAVCDGLGAERIADRLYS